MIQVEFIRYMHGFGFMKALVEDMMQDDPKKRPTIDEVAERFDTIQQSLSWWKLRSRAVLRTKSLLGSVIKSVPHWVRTCGYMYHHIDAVPRPPDSLRL
ncbi:hypothetical protein ABKN59_010148 [Abortiporus biennis]